VFDKTRTKILRKKYQKFGKEMGGLFIDDGAGQIVLAHTHPCHEDLSIV
jgi:hypothetical protein